MDRIGRIDKMGDMNGREVQYGGGLLVLHRLTYHLSLVTYHF